MKKQFIPMFVVLIAVIAIASMSMSYAEEEYAQFVGYGVDDNEGVKDVGTVTAEINSGGDLVINVYNGYPGYVAEVNFTIEHIGGAETPRIYLTVLDVTNAYAGVEMDVVVTDLAGDPIPLYTTYLDPGDRLEGLVTITILPDADQEASYGFSVDLTFDDLLE